MWCCCVGDGHMCKDKHCWRGLVISKQHVSIINTCADTCQHECVLLYVHACTHVCVYIYIYNHIYICTNIYIYIAHHCCPFVGRPLGLGTGRERLQRRTVCRQRLQKTASTRPPYVFSVSARAADQMWNLQSFHWSQEYMSHLWAVRFAAPRGWAQRLIREETPI